MSTNQTAVETPTLRTSQNITTHIYIYIYIYVHFYNDLFSIDINLFIRTKSYQSAVETTTLRTSQDITTFICIYIYIRSSTQKEYGIEILSSPGIQGIELEKQYLEYLRIQLTFKNLYLEYRWTI